MTARGHSPSSAPPRGGAAGRARVSRDELLADPHSGAKPLAGSPGGAKAPLKPRRRPAAAPVTPVYVLPASAAPAAAPAAVPAVAAPPAPSPAPAAPAAAPAPVPADDSTGPAASRGGGRRLSNEGSGALLAFLLYPLLVNGLRGGPAQAKGWLAAKFVNAPYGGPAPARKKQQKPNPQPKPGGGHPGVSPN